MLDVQVRSPKELREMIRQNQWVKPTSGLAKGHIQANLAVLPKEQAFDFLLFAQRNPKSCPIIDVTDPGSGIPTFSAPSGNIMTDIPKYRIYKQGILIDEKLPFVVASFF